MDTKSKSLGSFLTGVTKPPKLPLLLLVTGLLFLHLLLPAKFSHPSPTTISTTADTAKQFQIREMAKHAWDGYTRFAWMHDDLLPLSKQGFNWHGPGQSLLNTPIDSLDTLFLMGLMDEYNEAKELVLSHLDFDKVTEFVSLFETVIRVLGGLLAAYELDGDWRFIEKSVDLVERLLPAFESPTGFPTNKVRLARPLDHVNTTQVGIAEIGTLQLEFQYLSDITGNQTYANIALHIYDQLQKVPFVVPGLLPEYVDRETLTTSSPRVSIGGMGDSYYEYLLKLYLVTGETKYYDRYYASAEAILEHMAIKNKRGDTVVPATFFGKDDTTGKIEKYQENKWEHLGCFAGGMFTSGVIFANPKPHNWKQHFELGSGLTETCWKMYNQTGTGIGPENVDAEELNSIDASYMLRPEAVEALFYMWRFTHDPIYRERAWVIVQNYEKHCRDDTGYHGLTNVNYENNNYLDKQESFFIAETLKYLYLIFSDDDTVPLDKYVFNTEAHILSIRGHGRRSGVVRQ